jgi:hypothetical protein
MLETGFMITNFLYDDDNVLFFESRCEVFGCYDVGFICF